MRLCYLLINKLFEQGRFSVFMTSKEDQAAGRKEQILGAAAALFAEKGYYKTTTADVASAVGVTQPYVFHFFRTKEALYMSVLQRAAEQIRGAFRAVQASPDELEDAMGHAFRELLEGGFRSEVLLCMTAHSIPEPAIRQYVKEEFAGIHADLKERFEAAGFESPWFHATQFIGHGLVIALSELTGLKQLLPWAEGMDC
jgi:AcrR family transcriptional regulator